ncbi:hypothetical protein GEMRC1_007783 [Eukaryota sp. GEM-RC1]
MAPPLTNVVILTGLPVVPEGKLDKLSTFLTKTIKKTVAAPDNVDIPMSEGSSQGFAFVTFSASDHTERAVRELNDFRFDKKHTIRSSLLDDIHKYDDVPEEYPGPPDLKQTDSTPIDLQDYLLDRRARVQFLTHVGLPHGSRTSINNLDPIEGIKEREDDSREDWADEKLGGRWSPYGTYLATFHDRGIALWAGKSFSLIRRFAHSGARALTFSDKENYLLTATEADRHGHYSLKVFETVTGKLLRTFEMHKTEGHPLRIFKISACEKYLARVMKDKVAIYDLHNNMEPIRKAIIRESNVEVLAWSPREPILSLFVAEGNIPARIMMVAFDDDHAMVLRTKTLVQVRDVQLFWSAHGDFLLAKAKRTSKSGKTHQFGFELIKIKERAIPCMTLPDIKSVEVSHCAWDPTGATFAYIEADTTKTGLVVVCRIVGGEVKEIGRTQPRPFNTLYWCPKGNILVGIGLSTLGSTFAGHMDFILVQEDSIEVVESRQHSSCSFAQWSPCGRFFVTVVSQIRRTYDTGFNLFSMRGRPLVNVRKDKFYYFLFRPTPPPVLPEKKLQEVESGLKNFVDEFKAEDEALRNLGVGKEAEKRRQQRQEWVHYQKKWFETASHWKARDVVTWDEKEDVVETVVDMQEEEIVEVGLVQDEEEIVEVQPEQVEEEEK